MHGLRIDRNCNRKSGVDLARVIRRALFVSAALVGAPSVFAVSVQEFRDQLALELGHPAPVAAGLKAGDTLTEAGLVDIARTLGVSLATDKPARIVPDRLANVARGLLVGRVREAQRGRPSWPPQAPPWLPPGWDPRPPDRSPTLPPWGNWHRER